METQAFILGILSVIGVAVVTLVVVGMVKIYQLIKQHNSVLQQLNQAKSNIYSEIADQSRYFSRKLEEMDRQAENQIESVKRDLVSYVDSRIDKLQSKKEATTK